MKTRRITACVVAAAAAAAGGIVTATASSASAGVDPAAMITTVDPARSVYHLHDSVGHSMDTLKVVADPSSPGRFLGVYHWSTSAGYAVGVATSTDLKTWTYARTLDTGGSQPYLAFTPAPKNGPVLAEEAYAPSHLRFMYWTSVSNMLGTAAPYKTFDAPKTLSSCAEGTPDIRSVSYASANSTVTSGSTIVVGHHYFADCKADREALGTLTNFSKWTTTALPDVDGRLTAAGAPGKHGDRDVFAMNGQSFGLYEGGLVPASQQTMADWRNFLDDGTTVRQVNPRTAGGSTAFANPATTVATVGGVPSLIVTEFIPASGAARGEAGEMLFWNPIDQGPAPVPTATTPAPTSTQSAPPTSSSVPAPSTSSSVPVPSSSSPVSATTSTSASPAPAGPTKALVIMEENHSLAEMKSGMPYLYSLAQQYSYADHYTAITHPSEPNYIAIAFGSTMGDTADHTDAVGFAGPTVFSQALANGRSAKVYAESMSGNCNTGTASPYYVKHNPWPFESSPTGSGCATGDVPAGTTTGGQLLTDVRAGTLPNVGMLIPNICNDAHNCTLATADDWLKSWLPTIMSGPDFTTGRLAIVVTADEDDRKSGNTVLTTVVSRSLDGAHKVVSTPLTHYSLSAWLSRLAGGTPLREGASAPDLKAAFGF